MPLAKLKTPPFKPPRDAIVTWNTWRKGLNTLLRENEVDAAEMTQSTNIVLIGSGVPTKRWGSQDFYLSAPTGYGRFLGAYKDSSENREVLSMTSWGYLVKKSGASYAMIGGASWPSASYVEGIQLGDKVYITSETREMVKYDFSTLTSFVTLSTPAGLTATNLSLATGTTQWSWRVTANSNSGGETLGSDAYSLATLPQTLSDTRIRVTWSPVSTASGVLTGYNVYRGSPGDEVWIGGTDNTTTQFDDYGQTPTDAFRTVPLANSTGGLKAKYSLRFQDRLVFAGIPGEPSKVVISGRYPQQERFDWYAGGGYIYIEPDSEEIVTGLATYYQSSTSTQTIVVFKETSVWELRLSTVTFGQYTILEPTYRLLTRSQGCSSHRSIKPVENDIMFSNRKGIYILRYEPQLLNVINANEISAKIRPFFEGLTDADLISASAAYIDKKYVLSFPNSRQSIIFDRERLSFTGPWTTPFGIAQWASYVDSGGVERWVAIDSNDEYVTEFGKNYQDDKGTAINTIFKSRREDFGDWTIFKTINEVFMNFRDIVGVINVNIYTEDREGVTAIAKSFSTSSSGVSGTSGIGTDQMGTAIMGGTLNDASSFAGEVPKRAFLYKSSRIVQIEVRTTGNTSDYELLGAKIVGIPQARGNSPSSWNVTA